MPSRGIALFLAFVLLWSGFATIELPLASASAPLQAHAAGGVVDTPAAPPAGSVEHHHLDDQPLPPQPEPAADPPGVLPAAWKPRFARLAESPPDAYTWAGRRPPVLDGPLRPPCGAALKA